VTRPRPDATVAGYSIGTKYARVYLVDQFPASDPGMTTAEARALAAALIEAASKAERAPRRKVEP